MDYTPEKVGLDRKARIDTARAAVEYLGTGG
jgi:hypothetical protein